MKRFLVILLLALAGCGGSEIEYDYITDHGVMVTVGDVNAPTSKEVGLWTHETFGFWIERFPHLENCIIHHTKMIHVEFWDQNWVPSGWGKVAGLQSDYQLDVSNGPPEKIRGVYIHELSHVFSQRCLGVGSNDGSHAIFAEQNLCGLTKWC